MADLRKGSFELFLFFNILCIMNDALIAKIKEAHYEKLKPCREVINQIINYFGKDRVDATSFDATLPDSLFEFDQSFLDILQDEAHMFVDNDNFFNYWEAMKHDPEYRRKLCESLLVRGYGITDDSVNTELIDSVLENCTENARNLLVLEDRTFPIYVYFPKVTVVNECDDVHEITKVYVRFCINYDGTFGEYSDIEMTRSEYTASEFAAGYCHSHRRSICARDLGFASCCLGHGPLNSTINNLRNTCDYDVWGLFCFELEKYVATESLSGGPYIRMSRINASYKLDRNISNLLPHMDNGKKVLLRKFIRYYINNTNIKTAFVNGRFILGEDPNVARIKMSNLMVKWVNNGIATHVFSCTARRKIDNIFTHEYVSNGQFYTSDNSNAMNDLANVQGSGLAFAFNGNPVNINIIDDSDANKMCLSILVKWEVYAYIMNEIFTIINNEYGNKETNNSQTTVYF